MKKNTSKLFVLLFIFSILAPNLSIADEVVSGVENSAFQNSEETVIIENTNDIPSDSGDIESEVENKEVVSENVQIGPVIESAVSESSVSFKKVNLTIRKGSEVIFDEALSVENSGTVTVVDNTGSSHQISSDSVLGAVYSADNNSDLFQLSDLSYYSSFDSFLINCISHPTNTSGDCYNWQFVVSGVYPSVGVDDYIVNDGDHIYIYFGNPRRVAAPAVAIGNYNFYAVAEYYNYENDSWIPLSNYTVGLTQTNPNDAWNPIEVATSTTNSRGIAVLKAPAGSYSLGLKEDFYYPSTSISIEEAGERKSAILRIRNSDNLIFDNPVIFETGTTTIIDNTETTRETLRNSVLNIVKEADEASESFYLSDLAYYESFGSFIINCLEINNSPFCNNWQYVVNGNYSSVGVDDFELNGNEVVYLYFGNSKRIVTPESAVSGVSFSVTAESYDYENNSFLPLSGMIIGATQPDPLNPWNPTVIATSTTGDLGQANFNLQTGDYNFGFEADYYYPTYSFSVASSTITTGGSSGGGGTIIHNKPDIDNLVSFLKSKQKSDGSFDFDLYTDWASIAFGSIGDSPEKNKLINFLKIDVLDGNSITDYERRAMALMSLGINPYSDSNDYIKKIINSFDGTQIGDIGLFNDDVFGILVLMNAGYKSTDEIIRKSAEFIISKQSSDGSFESPDMTGASIQALSLVSDVSGAENAISKAKSFLKAIQGNDGEIGNTFGTSWSIMAFISSGENPNNILKNNKNLFDFLFSNQQTDGGMEVVSSSDSNRVWSTSYAIPAVLERSWDSIINNFNKPAVSSDNSNQSNIIKDNTSTSTPEFFASSTAVVKIEPKEVLGASIVKNNQIYNSEEEQKKDNFIKENFSEKSQSKNTLLAGVSGAGSFNFNLIIKLLGFVFIIFGMYYLKYAKS